MKPKILPFVVAVAVVSIGMESIQGQDSGQRPSAYECRFVDVAPKIDGIADDAAWKSAQVIDKFGLPWRKEKARPARTATKARLAWDREFLYFLAEMTVGPAAPEC